MNLYMYVYVYEYANIFEIVMTCLISCTCCRMYCANVKCAVLLHVRIWRAFIESEGSRIPGLCVKWILCLRSPSSSSRDHSVPAVLNSTQTRHTGAVFTSGSFLHPDHQGMCSWSISDPDSWSGLLCVERSRPHSAQSAMSEYEAWSRHRHNSSPVILFFFFISKIILHVLLCFFQVLSKHTRFVRHNWLLKGIARLSL